MTIRADIQSLAASAVIELFELDATRLGATGLLYFHAGTNELGIPVIWQGMSYQPFPLEATGFEWNGKGQLPRPKLRVANADGAMGGLIYQYAGLLGAKVTRRKTLAKFLDAANFTAGNPTADASQAYPDEVYFIDRKANENPVYIEFELASAFDLPGVMLPGRQYISNICPSQYRSPECSYAGGPVADANDNPVSLMSLDVCSRKISGCKLRGFTILPFGGFPGSGLMR
jgi:lambda family phage minor tail protein L